MKRFLLLTTALFFGLSLYSCDNSNKPHGKLDPNASISINVRNSLRADDNSHKSDWTEEDRIDPKWSKIAHERHLTPNEIVGLAAQLCRTYNGNFGNRSFIEKHRDYVNNKLLMWATDIIDQDGNIHTDFIDATDVIITLAKGDTIGYIPNKLLRETGVKIRKAYDEGNYDKVYQLFNTAFTALPITGEEYKALKAKGEN